MDTKSQKDHQAEARKHNALKAYWEKCAGSQREEKKELTFQHQKTINRQTNSKWTSDSKPAQNVPSSKESKTVVSFAIGNVDGSRVPSLHFQNNTKPMERKLQGDKHDLLRRNCVSALESRNTFRRSDDFQRTHQDDITNLRKSGELDFTEKIKAFRALIGTKPKSVNSQHKVDGAAKELGNHVMFIAQSRDTINIGNEEAELVHKPEYNAKDNRTKINITGRVARELKDLSYVSDKSGIPEDDLGHLNDPDFEHVTFQADIRALNFSLHEAEDHAYPMKQPNSSVVNQTSALERMSASANKYDSGYRPPEGAARDHVNKETQTSDMVEQVLEQDWNHVKTNHGRTRVIKRSRLHVPMDNKPFSADPKLFESRELTGEAHDENKFSDVTNTRQEHPNIKSTVSYATKSAPGRDRSVPALNGTLRSMSTVPETTNNRLQPLELVERSKSVTPLSVKATPVSYSDNNGHIDTPFMTQLKSQISVLSASLECLSSIVSNVPDSGRNTARSGSAGPGSLSERSSLISESPSNFVGKASRHAHKVVNRKTSDSDSNSSISDSQSRYSGSSSLKQTNVRGLEGVENLRISDGNKGKRFNADIVHETEATKEATKAHALPFKSDDLRKQELRKMVKYIFKRSNSWNNKHNPNRIHDDDTEMTRESNAGVAYLHSGKLGEECPQTGKTISTPKGEEFTRTNSRKSPLQIKSATGKINEKYNYKANTHAPLNNVRESVKEYTTKEELRINVQSEKTGSEPKIIKRNSQPTKGGQPTRSQSEVFFKNSLKEAIRHSPLPSKSNALQLLTKARPRSALDGLKSAPKTIEVQKNVSISRKDNKAKSQKLKDAHIPLKEKLQQLRSEIDKRLSSKENLAHFVQTYKLKELIGDEMGTNSEEHSLEDSSSYDSKSSESTEKRDSDGSFSEAVSTVTHYSSNDDIKKKAKAKHPFTAEEFLTSTPVKAPSTKQDDGNIYNQAGRNLMFSHTHRTFKKPSNIVTSEAMKERQLFQTSSASESRLPYASNKDSTRASNDDFNLLLTKQEKTLNLGEENVVIEPVTLHRSGSVGSKALSVNGRKDIMNRILTKMATRQESVSSSSSNTRSLQWPTVPSSGRESPAERLLNHLDNPRQIKLLQMLYQADPITRQIIMIKVEYFTAWHDFTIASRERRLKKNKLMKLSYNFYVVNLLSSHFNYWKERAMFCIKTRKADAVFRRHMLAKGFKALQWSVSQSMHLLQKLQTKYHSGLLQETFTKWKTKAMMQRRERIQNSFERWKQFVQETLKVRYMQGVSQRNKLIEVLRCWKKLFIKHQKINKASRYFRVKVLKHTMKCWKEFVYKYKVKKEKHQLAVKQHESTLQDRMFHIMISTYRTIQKTKAHFRYHFMKNVFHSWQGVTQIFKSERSVDMATSVEHWRAQRLHHSFFHWYEQLRIKRAEKMANYSLSKKFFKLWLKTWQDNIAYRCHIDQIMSHKKLHRSLLTWRQNVVTLKKRQKLAVELIENCHMRQTFNSWRCLTSAKRNLRKKVTMHQKAYEYKTIKSSFTKWWNLYTSRKEAENAKRIFSEACARKMLSHWRSLCYKRSLKRMLNCTQPQRDKRLMRVYFSSWLNSLDKVCQANVRGEDYLTLLGSKRLKNIFMYWLQETRKLLKIKPLVLHQRSTFMIEVFTSWRSLVQHKSECKRNVIVFQHRVLLNYFNSWKRQYKVCQIAKEIEQRLSQGLLLVVLDGWKYFSIRKKKSKLFQERLIMKHIFYLWKNKATTLYTYRTKLQEELESNLSLKRQSFNLWKENVLHQKSWMQQSLLHFMERQSNVCLVHYFLLWRKHLHSSLIAKAYNKTFNVRLLATYFSAWQQLTGSSMTEAVVTFSERIGLIDNRKSSTLVPAFNDLELTESGEEINFMSLTSITSDFSDSFSESIYSENGSEMDRRKLLTVAIEAAKEDRLAKCFKLKETVTKALTRLMHWPLCVAFEQWKEFSVRRSQLKAALTLLKSVHVRTITVMAFNCWKKSFDQAVKANSLWKLRVQEKYFRSLRVYKNYRKYIKHLSKRAYHHKMLKSFQKYFPVWQKKAQEKQQKNYILHLWTSATPREMELYHLENMLSKKINKGTLFLCFTHWFTKYKAITKIRCVYHTNLSLWVFVAWKNWAHERHKLMVRSQTLLQHRQTKLAFRKWCLRLEQNKKSELMHQQAWNNYLILILQSWQWWAKNNHKLQTLHDGFRRKLLSQKLTAYFDIWKSVTSKVKSFRNNSKQKILYRMFREWRCVVKNIQSEQRLILQFQIHSYTLLVKRLFHQWHDLFLLRKKCLEERTLQIEQNALSIALVWRRKSQKTRGFKLKYLLERRKLFHYFHHWKRSFTHVQMLYCQLEDWFLHKHVRLTKVYLRIWRVQTLAHRARKLQTSRLMLTLLMEWKAWTKVSRERRIRGLALKKALQERSLHIYFQYWVVMTRVKQSVQQNVETKLQIRIFKAWRIYTRRTCRLREMEALMSHRVNTRLLHNAFVTLRWRAEYCTSLNEMADKVVHDREMATMRAVLVLWKERINNIQAKRCYRLLLTVRVVKRWHKFVTSRRLEHQRDEDNWSKAIRFYNKKLCKSVLTALKQEVSVHKLVEQRRQRICERCAMKWKSRVDLTITAVEMEREFNLRRFWSKWRTEYIRCSSVNSLCNQYDKHTLRQIFKAWQKLCQKQPMMLLQTTTIPLSSVSPTEPRNSLLPIPVSQSKAMQGHKTSHKS
ncbi:SFI1 [Biomphalaria glabrata]|nr:SFI1 [Biomphalaria glabrata]